MRAFGFISLLITLSIIGYMMAEQQKNGTGEIQTVTAKKAEDVAAHMMLQQKMGDVKTAILAYKAEKENFPPNLQSLVDANYIRTVPSELIYDPATGQVSMP